MNPKKIVVGVNRSAASTTALEWAVEEAVSKDAEIIAVHVLRPMRAGAGTLSVGEVRLREFDYLGDRTRSHVESELFGPLTTSAVRHRIVIAEGHPATEILGVADAEDAALIVVGNGLHSTVGDLFLGSVAHELTHRSWRPLTVVPIAARAVEIKAAGQGPLRSVVPRQTDSHRVGEYLNEK